MKITIYELLGLIKDGKAPNEIEFDTEYYTYHEDLGYIRTKENGLYIGLNEDYNLSKCLNDEVEIIEEEKEIYKRVKIIDGGKFYSSYEKWIKKHFPEYKNKWICDNRDYDKSKEYILIGTAKHDILYKDIGLIQDPNTKQVFIFDIEGLKEEKEIEKIDFTTLGTQKEKNRVMKDTINQLINEIKNLKKVD